MKMSSWFGKWFGPRTTGSSLPRRGSQSKPAARRFRPAVEQLEERCVPAAFDYVLTSPIIIPPDQLPPNTNPNSVAIADFNGDGKLDLAVANTDTDNVSVLLGNGNGTFSSAQNFAAGDGPQSVAIGDFNGDGKRDLAVANGFSNNLS